MKKYLLFITYFFSLFTFSSAQNPLVKQWDYRFGGNADDLLYSFQQTADGGFILGGWSRSGITGDKTQAVWGLYDYWIVKTDSLGNKQWDKDFGGTENDDLIALTQTADGGYILGGNSWSGISGDKTQAKWGGFDYWIIKTDSLGNKQWDKDFGGNDDDYLFSVQQTSDGGYILGGISRSGISGDKTQNTLGSFDFWIVKIDPLGNKQWDKDYGGTDDDELYSLQQTADKGYILGGFSRSGIGGDKSQATWGNWDYWIVKIDSLGAKQWDKDLGGIGIDHLSSLVLTDDGGYLLGGWSESGISGDKTQPIWDTCLTCNKGDYWIVKTDSLGNKQWDKDFGGTNIDALFSIFLTNDRGYIFGGWSASGISGNKTENNLGPKQTWIVKTDSSGNMQWDKTIFTTGFDDNNLAIQTKDGCYVMANATNGGIGGYKTQPAHGGSYDYWIIKFCDTTSTTSINPISNFQFPISVSPNPFTSDITITIQKPYIYKVSFTIKNVLGQTVYSKQLQTPNLKPQILDLSSLSKGIYLLEATVDDERVVKKIVKE